MAKTLRNAVCRTGISHSATLFACAMMFVAYCTCMNTAAKREPCSYACIPETACQMTVIRRLPTDSTNLLQCRRLLGFEVLQPSLRLRLLAKLLPVVCTLQPQMLFQRLTWGSAG